MKIRSMLARILAAAAVCSLLALPCGCADDTETGSAGSPAPEVTSADVSGSDVSSSDIIFAADESDPVYAVLSSAEALNRRDLDGYMSTIDPDSGVYDITLEDAKYMFAHYRLSVSIDDVDIKSLDDTSAVVTVTQTTLPVAEQADTSVSGSDVSASDVSGSDIPAPLSGKDLTAEFTPCVTVLTHTLTNIDGRWYITSTVVESYREISTQWDLLGEISAADPQSLVLSGNLPVSPADAASGADAE